MPCLRRIASMSSDSDASSPPFLRFVPGHRGRRPAGDMAGAATPGRPRNRARRPARRGVPSVAGSRRNAPRPARGEIEQHGERDDGEPEPDRRMNTRPVARPPPPCLPAAQCDRARPCAARRSSETAAIRVARRNLRRHPVSRAVARPAPDSATHTAAVGTAHPSSYASCRSRTWLSNPHANTSPSHPASPAAKRPCPSGGLGSISGGVSSPVPDHAAVRGPAGR